MMVVVEIVNMAMAAAGGTMKGHCWGRWDGVGTAAADCGGSNGDDDHGDGDDKAGDDDGNGESEVSSYHLSTVFFLPEQLLSRSLSFLH